MHILVQGWHAAPQPVAKRHRESTDWVWGPLEKPHRLAPIPKRHPTVPLRPPASPKHPHGPVDHARAERAPRDRAAEKPLKPAHKKGPPVLAHNAQTATGAAQRLAVPDTRCYPAPPPWANPKFAATA